MSATEPNGPYISRITLPEGGDYIIKDSWARSQIAAITGTSALTFRGVSNTALTDNGTEVPTITGSTTTAGDLGVGDIYFYGASEYIWGPDGKWHELGNLTNLGGLAYKNEVSTTYKPEGTISKPIFTGSAMNMSTSYTPAGGVTLNVTTGNHNYTVNGTTGTITYTPQGSVGSATFSGTEATISMSKKYTPAGSVSFTTATMTLNLTASSTTDGNYQPDGEISTPTITLASAGTTTYINNPISKMVASGLTATAPGETSPNNSITYYDVSNENLRLYQIGYDTTDSINTSSIAVKTGDASYQSTKPTFTGKTVQMTLDSFTLPTSASFSGTEATIAMSTQYTPEGVNSTAQFTGTGTRLITSSIVLPDQITGTFTGTTATIAMEGTPEGTITTPTFSGTTTTITLS